MSLVYLELSSHNESLPKWLPFHRWFRFFISHYDRHAFGVLVLLSSPCTQIFPSSFLIPSILLHLSWWCPFCICPSPLRLEPPTFQSAWYMVGTFQQSALIFSHWFSYMDCVVSVRCYIFVFWCRLLLFLFPGWGCQPYGQPPTWSARVSFVWLSQLDLSSTVDSAGGTKAPPWHTSKQTTTPTTR